MFPDLPEVTVVVDPVLCQPRGSCVPPRLRTYAVFPPVDPELPEFPELPDVGEADCRTRRTISTARSIGMNHVTPAELTVRSLRIPGVQSLRIHDADGLTRSVVLVLHGGRERSDQPTSARQLAYLRMVPFARAVHRAIGSAGGAVWLLRNRVRGWNEPALDAVADARWALAQIRLRHPRAAIVLVGHSMGARVALRLAGTDNVLGVCALAPWIKPNEPIGQLAGRTVVIVHGDRDTWTSPSASYDYAVRAAAKGVRICRFTVPGGRHVMLRRAADWSGLVAAFVAQTVGAAPAHPAIAAALDAPVPDGLRRVLPTGVW